MNARAPLPTESTGPSIDEQGLSLSPAEEDADWTAAACRRLGWLLLAGALCPLPRRSLFAGETIWFWPWSWLDLDATEAMALAPADASGSFVPWALTPLLGGAALLALGRWGGARARRGGLMAVGVGILGLLQLVFVDELVVYGLPVVLPDLRFQLGVVVIVLGSGCVAVSNHLMGTYSVLTLPRVLAGAGGLVLLALLCLPLPGWGEAIGPQLLTRSSWGSDWPYSLLVVGIAVYGLCGLGLASCRWPPEGLQRSISLLGRLALVWLPLSVLIVRENQDDPFRAAVLEGGGGLEVAGFALARFCLIHLSAAVALLVGVATVLSTRLWARSARPDAARLEPWSRVKCLTVWGSSTAGVALFLLLGGGGGESAEARAHGTRPRRVSERPPLWRLDSGAPWSTPPVSVDDDLVLVGDVAGVVHGVNTADGSERWRLQTGGAVASTPQIVSGTGFFGSADGNLYAVDPIRGRVLWKLPCAGPIESAPWVGTHTLVVITAGSRRATVHGIDPHAGSHRWQLPLAGGTVGAPVSDGVLVFFVENDQDGNGHMRVVDAETGELLWSVDAPGRILAGPALSENLLVFGDEHGVLHAVDTAAERVAWERATPSAIRAAPWIEADGKGGGRVHVASERGTFTVLDVATGVVAGTVDIGEPLRACPVVRDGRAYLQTADGHLVVVDLNSWTVAGRLSTCRHMEHPPALEANRLIIAAPDGTLLAHPLPRP